MSERATRSRNNFKTIRGTHSASSVSSGKGFLYTGFLKPSGQYLSEVLSNSVHDDHCVCVPDCSLRSKIFEGVSQDYLTMLPQPFFFFLW